VPSSAQPISKPTPPNGVASSNRSTYVNANQKHAGAEAALGDNKGEIEPVRGPGHLP
jgi:hypothetical protein